MEGPQPDHVTPRGATSQGGPQPASGVAVNLAPVPGAPDLVLGLTSKPKETPRWEDSLNVCSVCVRESEGKRGRGSCKKSSDVNFFLIFLYFISAFSFLPIQEEVDLSSPLTLEQQRN